jgi:hypothetical protein
VAAAAVRRGGRGDDGDEEQYGHDDHDHRDPGDDEPARPARSLLADPLRLRLRLWLRLLHFAVTHEASPSEL